MSHPGKKTVCGQARYFFFVILSLFSFFIFSQNKLEVINTDNSPVFSKLNYKKDFASREEVKQQVRKIVTSLEADGYILASADSLVSDSLLHKLYLTIGNQYKLAALKKGNAEDNLLSEIGYSEKFYTKKVFKSREVSKLIEKILAYYENNGYPFAAVKFDNIVIDEKNISLDLKISKNKMIKLDSLVLQGDLKISKPFLYRYLEIKPGSLYNEQSIRNVSVKLKQLPFLKETRSPVVRLTEKINKVYIFANKKNASQFDGIIGLLPSAGGKTIFTGDVKIKLQNNIFKAGETMEINWRRLQSQTQDLKTRVVYPYIFKTFIGVEHTLKLYKRDTTFIDVQNNLGLAYMFKGLNNIKGFYRQRNSNLLSTSSLTGLSTLPDYADITTRAYGLGLFYEKLDYNFNPRKGVSITINGSAGQRVIRKNAKLNDVIYNGVNLNTSQYQGEAQAAGYIPVFKKATIKFATQLATINSRQIFKNELFRIGGLKTLRGFDEESIFASTYAIGTLEYRYLLDENSAIFLFTDGCWYEKASVTGYVHDTPVGVGAGMSFETKAGIFSLTYALGKQFNNSFDIRSGKIHFGIVNSF